VIPLTLAEVAAATGGRLVGAEPTDVVSAVSTDSRACGPGDLFVAIVGATHDAHDHVPAAIAAGAVAALVSRPVEAPCVVVDDTVVALGRLARAVVDRLPACQVVAITGSSGKTSTKDLVAAVLADAAETTPPRTGAVINVGSAHLELLGSREAIAEAKGEILDDLPDDGIAVLHADNPLVMAQAHRTRARIVTFGEAPDATVRASDVRLDSRARPAFVLHHGDQSLPVTLTISGEHQVANALAATAMALGAGMSLDEIVAGLEAYQPASRWRMDVAERADGVVVINDAYNANPESMRAGLKALVAMAGATDPPARTWAVLGEMREIGDTSVEEHDAIGRLVVRLDVNRLIAVGEGARPIHLGASHEGSWGDESTWVPDADAALALLESEVRPGDIVFVKASRSIGLDAVATGLLRDAEDGG